MKSRPTASSSAAVRDTTITRAPIAASSNAASRPMPRPPPVTSATRPFIVKLPYPAAASVAEPNAQRHAGGRARCVPNRGRSVGNSSRARQFRAGAVPRIEAVIPVSPEVTARHQPGSSPELSFHARRARCCATGLQHGAGWVGELNCRIGLEAVAALVLDVLLDALSAHRECRYRAASWRGEDDERLRHCAKIIATRAIPESVARAALPRLERWIGRGLHER